MELVAGRASGRADIDQAFADTMAKGVNDLFVLGDGSPITGPAEARILELLAGNRLPAVSDETEFHNRWGILREAIGACR
jgi:hypothetical protein